MQNYISTLANEFKANAHAKTANEQAAYMKNNFVFWGIKTPLRRKIQKPFLDKNHLPAKNKAFEIIKILWQKPEREFQYFAQELALQYINQIEKNDIKLFEYMITHQSWWDSVDFIATKLIAAYFKQFPEMQTKLIKKWVKSDSVWLQRTAILFQLHYKNNVDTILLTQIINELKTSNNFFIQKAIGWMLRQYSRTNPAWVTNFVAKTKLHNLTRKEALKLLSI